jgi:glycerol-3-phosphate acyltransferase PlsY
MTDKEIVFAIFFIVCAYLLGAVPFGIIFGKLFSRIDVRTAGSGNIGATNVLRTAGKKAAFLTLLADALKGYLPVLIANYLFHNDLITVGAGAAAILGHNYPIYLGFKGGKGVATGYGVILAVSPWIGLASLLIWISAAAFWRYSSLAALISFASYPVMTFSVASFSKPYQLLSLFLFGLIYYRHRENIKRLLAGTEPKIGKKHHEA